LQRIRIIEIRGNKDKDRWRKNIERGEERNNEWHCGRGEEKYRGVGGLVGARRL
jgi:hypothetical protein